MSKPADLLRNVLPQGLSLEGLLPQRLLPRNLSPRTLLQPALTATHRKSYLRRLAESQLIQPVTDADWYQPQVLLKGSGQTTPLPITPWPEHDTPAVSAFRRELLQHLSRHQTRALLVMHRGQLIWEHYQNFEAQRRFNSMSMTKTVMALLIGIAIDRGLIGSVQEPVADYLPQWRHDARRLITIEHLLTMQSGLLSDVKLRRPWGLPAVLPLYLGHDVAQAALSVPAVAPPGQYFEYNNVNTQLLGLVLAAASGQPLPDIYSQWLWQPLGAQDARLWADDHGMVRTFAALFATPQDWLRLGQLFLNQGQANGRQIVSAQWLAQMRIPRNLRRDYGYQVWLRAHDYGLIRGIPFFEAMHARQPLRHEQVFFMEGMRGQYLYIDPKNELIVLRMGEKPCSDWDASYFINAISDQLTTDT